MQRSSRARGTGNEAGPIVVKYDLKAETVFRLLRPEGVFTDLSFHVIVFTWHFGPLRFLEGNTSSVSDSSWIGGILRVRERNL